MMVTLAAWGVFSLSGFAASTPESAATQRLARDTLPLFASEEPLEFALAADFGQLKGDRRGEAPERPATLRFVSDSGAAVLIDAQLRTRGRFRRSAANCTFPPLRLNLKKQQTKGTPFADQDKLKIVVSCRPNRRSFEQLVLLEYLAYRALELVTDAAFRTRLARITYVDASGKSDDFTRFAFLVEDDDALAGRLGGRAFDLAPGKNLPPALFAPSASATVAVFQYMIGNTDWSAIAGHNVQAIDIRGAAVPVPYDFDFSGLVDAPYANPGPGLGIGTVKERAYRGWCWDDVDYAPVLRRFRDAEPAVLSLFERFPYLSGGERNRSVRYLKAFFEEIETDERARRGFIGHCRTLPKK